MDFLKKNKMVTALAVLAILVLAYFGISSLGSTAPALTSTDSSIDPQSQQLLVTLANLHTIRLDGAIFNNPVFLSLVDSDVVIQQPPVIGRSNPFAPAAATSTSAAAAAQNTKITPPALTH